MLYGDGLEPYGFSFFTAVKISTTKTMNKREELMEMVEGEMGNFSQWTKC